MCSLMWRDGEKATCRLLQCKGSESGLMWNVDLFELTGAVRPSLSPSNNNTTQHGQQYNSIEECIELQYIRVSPTVQSQQTRF